MYISPSTHQANKDAEKLHHIGVGHRIKSSNQGVEDGDESRYNHWHLDIDVHDDTQRSS